MCLCEVATCDALDLGATLGFQEVRRPKPSKEERPLCEVLKGVISFYV
jgi:hypothetical protein